jgi:hypothetical protein
MAQAINGVQQAGTDRAQRMAQMLEQRHLQVEMAAAAFAREDQRHSAEVAKPGESFHAHAGDHDGGGGAEHEGRDRKKHADEPPPPPPDAASGHLVDLTA